MAVQATFLAVLGVLCVGLVVGNSPLVGRLKLPGKDPHCYGAAIAPQLVLTSAECAFDSATGRTHSSLQFSLRTGGTVKVKKVHIFPGWLRNKTPLNSIATLSLASGLQTPGTRLVWSPYSLEQVNVSLKSATNNIKCSTGRQSDKNMEYAGNELAAVSCPGSQQHLRLPGSPAYQTSSVDNTVAIFAVHVGECSSEWGPLATVPRGPCATRLNQKIFQDICSFADKEKQTVPGCEDVLLRDVDPDMPSSLLTTEAYTALVNRQREYGIILLFCRGCSEDTCEQGCRSCHQESLQRYDRLSLYTRFYGRVLVARVDADKLRFKIPYAPYILYRLPDTLQFREHHGYLTELVQLFEDSSSGGGKARTRSKRMLSGLRDGVVQACWSVIQAVIAPFVGRGYQIVTEEDNGGGSVTGCSVTQGQLRSLNGDLRNKETGEAVGAGEALPVGTVLEARCTGGRAIKGRYPVQASLEIRCMDSGRFEPPVPQCTRTCRLVSDAKRNKFMQFPAMKIPFTPLSGGLQQDYSPAIFTEARMNIDMLQGDTVTFTCPVNAILRGTNQRTDTYKCNRGSQRTVVQCEAAPRPCDVPDTPHADTSESGQIADNSQVTVSCHGNRRLWDTDFSKQVTLNCKDGKLDPDPDTLDCIETCAIDAPPIPDDKRQQPPEFNLQTGPGKFRKISPPGRVWKDAKVLYECGDSEWQLAGTASSSQLATCTAGGAMNPAITPCNVRCLVPVPVPAAGERAVQLQRGGANVAGNHILSQQQVSISCPADTLMYSVGENIFWERNTALPRVNRQSTCGVSGFDFDFPTCVDVRYFSNKFLDEHVHLGSTPPDLATYCTGKLNAIGANIKTFMVLPSHVQLKSLNRLVVNNLAMGANIVANSGANWLTLYKTKDQYNLFVCDRTSGSLKTQEKKQKVFVGFRRRETDLAWQLYHYDYRTPGDALELV